MEVTSKPLEPPGPAVPAADDTAAFQRFYFEEDKVPVRSLWYRVCVGWWRHRP